MSITTSLDNATQQLLALLQELEQTNVQFLGCQDIGSADAYVFNPTPRPSAISASLLLMVDIANPNQTATPTVTVQGVGSAPLVGASGAPVPVGAVAGKCLIAFSTAQGGGFQARLLISPVSLGGGTGITVNGGVANLDIGKLTAISTAQAADFFPILTEESEGGQQPGIFRISAQTLATIIQPLLPGFGLRSQAQAWCNMDATTSPSTVRASYNVSSVSKLSTGYYKYTFAKAVNFPYGIAFSDSSTSDGTYLTDSFLDANNPPTANDITLATNLFNQYGTFAADVPIVSWVIF